MVNVGRQAKMPQVILWWWQNFSRSIRCVFLALLFFDTDAFGSTADVSQWIYLSLRRWGKYVTVVLWPNTFFQVLKAFAAMVGLSIKDVSTWAFCYCDWVGSQLTKSFFFAFSGPDISVRSLDGARNTHFTSGMNFVQGSRFEPQRAD